MARQQNEQRRSDGADEVADIDDDPRPQHLAEPDLAGSPGHDHQRVAGEELSAADDDQDEPEAEDHARQKAADAERNTTVRPCEDGRREHASEPDEGSGECGECDEAEEIESDFLGPDRFGLARDFHGNERVDAVHGRVFIVRCHLFSLPSHLTRTLLSLRFAQVH